MRFSIQTLLLPGKDISEKFDNAARFGFDAVEVAIGPDFDLSQNLPQIRSASQASGLPVSAICTHPIHDPLVPSIAERQHRFNILAQLMGMADELGAGGVVSVPIRPPHSYPNLAPWKTTYELLREFTVETLKAWLHTIPDGNSRLFLEPLNRYETFFLNRVGQVVELCQAIGHPRVLALADLFHMNIEETDLAEPIKAAGSYLGHVHIADNNRLQPGKGSLDFRPPFAALKSINYRGFISIECWSPDGPKIAGEPNEALPKTVQYMHQIWNSAQSARR